MWARLWKVLESQSKNRIVWNQTAERFKIFDKLLQGERTVHASAPWHESEVQHFNAREENKRSEDHCSPKWVLFQFGWQHLQALLNKGHWSSNH